LQNNTRETVPAEKYGNLLVQRNPYNSTSALGVQQKSAEEEGKGRSGREMVKLKKHSLVLANTRPRDDPYSNCFKPSQHASTSAK